MQVREDGTLPYDTLYDKMVLYATRREITSCSNMLFASGADGRSEQQDVCHLGGKLGLPVAGAAPLLLPWARNATCWCLCELLFIFVINAFVLWYTRGERGQTKPV